MPVVEEAFGDRGGGGPHLLDRHDVGARPGPPRLDAAPLRGPDSIDIERRDPQHGCQVSGVRDAPVSFGGPISRPPGMPLPSDLG